MAVRSFLDPEGREWNVWEVIPSRKSDLFLPSTMAEGWLCFEAAHEKRRLHPMSIEWEGMDEPALWRLCQSAAPPRRPATRARVHVTAAEPAPAEAGLSPGDDTDARPTIRERSVREVVERTRDMIRKTRELLNSSRDLLDRVRHRDGYALGDHGADEALDDDAGADAPPVEGLNGSE